MSTFKDMDETLHVSLMVFSKIPGGAPVKTRLSETSGLSSAHSRLLAKAFLADTLMLSTQMAGNVYLVSEPEITHEDLILVFEELPVMLKEEIYANLSLFPQTKNSFGERLIDAVTDVFEQDPGPLLIIGSDAPLLPKRTLLAGAKLVSQGIPVIGPTPGGGIYLIGLPEDYIGTKLCSRESRFAEAFHNPTQTELQTLFQTIAEELTTPELLELHFDVDVAEDLATLLALLDCKESGAPHTRKVVQALGLSVSQDKENTRKLQVTTALS